MSQQSYTIGYEDVDSKYEFLVEQRFVTALMVSDDFTQRVYNNLEGWIKLLIVDQYQWLARMCVDYYAEHHKAPGTAYLTTLYFKNIDAERARGMTDVTAELIEKGLQVVSDEYEKGDGKLDIEQVYQDAKTLFAKRDIEAAIEEAEAANKQGDLDRVRQAGWRMATVAPSEETLFDPWAEPEALRFDLTWLPPLLRHYVNVRAQVSGCQIGPVAWSVLGGCSAALDGSLRIQPKPYDPFWSVPPDLWVLLIGDPSSGKTPALAAGYQPIFDIQRARQNRYQHKYRIWEQQDKEIRDSAPTREPLLHINSTTIEGIRDTLTAQDRGILVYSDEWAHFYGGIGRYSGGRDAAAADRAFYNTLFDGAPYTTIRADRKTGQQIYVRNLQGGVAGGTHPEYLHRANRDNALLIDGLFQRACPIFAGKRGDEQRVDTREVSKSFKELIQKLIRVPGHRTLVLTAEADELREAVSRRIMQFERNSSLGMGFTTAAGKLHGIFARLAGVVAHVLSPIDPVTEIGLAPATIAETLLFNSLLPNMLLTYRMLGSGGGEIETTRAICAFLVRERQLRVRTSDVMRHVHMLHHKKLDEVRSALSVVVGFGWLTPEGGDERRARAWVVNQSIYTQFTHRAHQTRYDAQMARNLMAATLKPNADVTGEDNDNEDDVEDDPKARKAIARACARNARDPNLEENDGLPQSRHKKARKAIARDLIIKPPFAIDMENARAQSNRASESARNTVPNSFSRFFDHNSWRSKVYHNVLKGKLAALTESKAEINDKDDEQ